MDISDFQKKVAKALGSGATKANYSGFLNFTCPLAPFTHEHGTDSTPSMGINPNGFLSCFACHYKGTLPDLCQELVVKYGTECPYPVKDLLTLWRDKEHNTPLFDCDSYSAPPKIEIDFPYPEDWFNSFGKVSSFNRAMEYLNNREGGGYPLSLLEELEIRFDSQLDRIMFPYRNKNTDIIGARGRLIKEGDPKYYVYRYGQGETAKVNRYASIGLDKLDLGKPLVITESVFDYMRVYQVYRNVWAPLSSGVTKTQLINVESVPRVITLYDKDKAGDSARSVTERYFKGKSVEHLIPESDAGDMTFQQVRDILAPHLDSI